MIEGKKCLITPAPIPAEQEWPLGIWEDNWTHLLLRDFYCVEEPCATLTYAVLNYFTSHNICLAIHMERGKGCHYVPDNNAECCESLWLQISNRRDIIHYHPLSRTAGDQAGIIKKTLNKKELRRTAWFGTSYRRSKRCLWRTFTLGCAFMVECSAERWQTSPRLRELKASAGRGADLWTLI